MSIFGAVLIYLIGAFVQSIKKLN